ncbi:MAG: hypothetical protein ACM33T_14815 [Solirubrobacterales bacterium]
MSVSASPAIPSPSSEHWLADAVDVGGRSAPRKDMKMFAEEEPSFWDLVDVVNPLQHIPVVNTLYREATGDQIGVGARLAGGALFGGPVGLLVSAIGIGVEEETGKDIGGHVLALFRDGDAGPADGATQVAEAKQEPAKAVAGTAVPTAAAPPALTDAAVPTGPKMLIGADGPVADIAALPAAAPVAVTADPLSAPKPIRLTDASPAPRFLPVPGRSGAVSARTPSTPVTVPVSNSGSRSNVPVTGRDPVSQGMGVNPATVQRILAEQGHANAVHPLVPPLPGAQPAAGVSPAAKAPVAETFAASPAPVSAAVAAPRATSSAPAAATSQDWFTAAMTRGLDKYEQAARLSRPGDAPTQLQ